MSTALDFTYGRITVENGASVATVTDANTDFFDRGTAIFVLGPDGMLLPVEGTQGQNSSELKLLKVWEQGTVTDVPFAAFNTIEGLVSTLRLARETVNTAQQIGTDLQNILESFSQYTIENLMGQEDAAGWRDALEVIHKTSDGRAKIANAIDADDAMALGQLYNKVAGDFAQLDGGNWGVTGLGGRGYGSSRCDFTGNANTVSASGTYSTSASTVGLPDELSGGQLHGPLSHFSRLGSEQYQIWVSVETSRMFWRSRYSTTAGVWRVWKEFWDESSLPDPARLTGANTFSGKNIFRVTGGTSDLPVVMYRSGSSSSYSLIEYRTYDNLNGYVGVSGNGEFAFVNSDYLPKLRVDSSGNGRFWGSLQVDGTINETSDIRLKDNSKILIDEEILMQVWPNVRSKLFQWKHAIEKKGEDEARWHAGYMVQEIEQAFINAGVNPEPFALWAKTPIEEEMETGETENVWQPMYETETYESEEVKVIEGEAVRCCETSEREVPVMCERELKDQNGSVIMETVTLPTGEADEDGNPITQEVTRPKVVRVHKHELREVPITVKQVVDHSYHLRYSQVLVWETTYLRRRIDALEAQ